MSEQSLAHYPCRWPATTRQNFARKSPTKDVQHGSRGLPMTFPVLVIAKVFLNDPPRWLSGVELCNSLGFPTSTIYEVLYRMEAAKWLSSSPDAKGELPPNGRRRMVYRITSVGHQQASLALNYLRSAAT